MIQRRVILNQIIRKMQQSAFSTTNQTLYKLKLPIGSELLLNPYRDQLNMTASRLNDIMYDRGAMHHGPNDTLQMIKKSVKKHCLYTYIDYILLYAYLRNIFMYGYLHHMQWIKIKDYSIQLRQQIESNHNKTYSLYSEYQIKINKFMPRWSEKNDPINNTC